MAKQDEITATADTSVAAGFSHDSPPPHSTFPEYTDRTISTRDWAARNFTDLPGQLKAYLVSLFPIATWIYRYNLTWLAGDVIAGLTVGAVVVPQGMGYAILATLPPEYGLYSSFIGCFIYCFFATSKDVTIGPVAVMSLEVAKIIAQVKHITGNEFTNPQIASSLALICGIISAGIGFLRIGFILEFIPAPAVAGFVTGSAFTIITGQVPALLGISKRFNTRDSACRVVINTLKNLRHTTVDAAFGLSALFALYFIRWACDKAGRRWPQHRRAFFFAGVMRNGLVVLIVTIAAYLVTKDQPKNKYSISILKTVPRGFRAIGTPIITPRMLSGMAGQIPVAIIILLLEHIAIAKSFGRINDYKIVPDQEVIAIGLNNIIGSFFGAYPATGSISRTALKSKSGVRTPAAGIVTGIMVLLALYALTDAFYFIPMAGLSAVIIHAVTDLMSHPRQVFIFWRVQPVEAIIFLAAVFIIIFTNIENGVYFAIATSAALLLYRIARPRGQFLGRLRLSDGQTTKEVFVPLDRRTINPDAKIRNPPPGVIIYRFSESFTYPNSSTQCDIIVDEVKRITKRGKANGFPTLGDRPWNDIGPRAGFDAETIARDNRPVLRAIILDMSAVTTIDTTGIQSLVDTRRQINKYADREVEYHFASITSPWVRRALIAGGFGTGTPLKEIVQIAPVVPSSNWGRSKEASKPEGAETGLAKRVEQYLADNSFRDGRFQLKDNYDLENEDGPEKDEHWGVLMPQDTPFFHIGIPDLSLPEYSQPHPYEVYEEKLKTDSNHSSEGSPRLGDSTS